MSGWYFVISLSRGFAANMSLHNVNSMNCMAIYGEEAFGGGWSYGCPMTNNMFGLNRRCSGIFGCHMCMTIAMLAWHFLESVHHMFPHS